MTMQIENNNARQLTLAAGSHTCLWHQLELCHANNIVVLGAFKAYNIG